MASWLLGLALAALVAVLATLYLWLVRRPETETAAGLRALASLRWREFATLVGQAMQKRGLRDAHGSPDPYATDSTSSQLLMTDGDSRWLLACKHGMAYRLGASSVEELAAAMDLSGARSGILLTQGHVERDALTAAAHRGIEVIDGRRLWPLLKPFLPAEARVRIVTASIAQAKRHTAIAVGAALTLGLAVAVLVPRLLSTDSANQAPVAQAAAEAAAATASDPANTAATATGATTAAAAAADTDTLDGNPDDATLSRYQGAIARTLSDTPGITRAYWLTRATLVVDRSASDAMVWPLICGELERYPALRTTRVQLNPRPGSSDAVRWRQCRTL